MQENAYENKQNHTDNEQDSEHTSTRLDADYATNNNNMGNHFTQKHETLNGIGLLSLINDLKHSIDSLHNKKIEDLEYKILEKEEALSELEVEIATLKAQNEEKDLELYRLHEEINTGKQLLSQLLEKLENHS